MLYFCHKLRQFKGISPWRVSNPLNGGICVTLPGALTIRPPDRYKPIWLYMYHDFNIEYVNLQQNIEMKTTNDHDQSGLYSEVVLILK